MVDPNQVFSNSARNSSLLLSSGSLPHSSLVTSLPASAGAKKKHWCRMKKKTMAWKKKQHDPLISFVKKLTNDLRNTQQCDTIDIQIDAGVSGCTGAVDSGFIPCFGEQPLFAVCVSRATPSAPLATAPCCPAVVVHDKEVACHAGRWPCHTKYSPLAVDNPKIFLFHPHHVRSVMAMNISTTLHLRGPARNSRISRQSVSERPAKKCEIILREQKRFPKTRTTRPRKVQRTQRNLVNHTSRKKII